MNKSWELLIYKPTVSRFERLYFDIQMRDIVLNTEQSYFLPQNHEIPLPRNSFKPNSERKSK